MKAFYPITTNEIIHKGKEGNIYRLDGIEKCHSLYLDLDLESNSNFSTHLVTSNLPTDIQSGVELINSVHNPIILESYKNGMPEDIANSSGLMWQPKLLNFAIEQALTSKMVVDEAIENTGAIAITGGGHHAEINRPFGFCPINTMAIAAIYAKSKGLNVAIIDLDTHYSNGCIDILNGESNINVFSIWNQTLDKWKYYENGNNVWHQKVKNDTEYFIQLDELTNRVKDLKPDFIIYHLGLDVLESDRMGGVPGMSESKLFKRDEIIRKLIQVDLNTKFCIFFGGAYIDRTKGEIYAKAQKEQSTAFQKKILKSYIVE
jgi:acetoin utilization deacetylase AcuC-like enzyme